MNKNSNDTNDSISRFFDGHSARWGRHYTQTGIGLHLFNSIFRRGLKRRWEIAMRYALPAEWKTYLDIGCGTGDYSVALAEAGATHVTGIDFAPAMVDASRRHASAHNLEQRSEFICGDFTQTEFARRFDVVFAIGVFDYISESEAFWRKMIASSNGIVIGSFPGHSLLREPIRTWRYRRRGLPVFFYSENQLAALGQQEGLKHFDLLPYPAGYALIGYVA